MPAVPTILTGGSLQGQPQEYANPNEFGAGVGEAVQNLGSSMQQAVGAASKIAEFKKNQADTQWVGDAMTQEQNYVNSWMAKPENNAKETFADDLKGILTDRQTENEKAAPSLEAKQAFRRQFQEYSVSRLQAANHTTAANQIQGLQESVLNQIDGAVQNYRVSRDIPDVDASADLTDSISNINGTIDKMFGQIAPMTARTLKNKLTVDAVYGAMDYSPDLATNILNSSSIEGTQRHVLEDEIKRAQTAKNAEDTTAFEAYRRNWVTMVEQGKKQDKISLGLYQSIYPGKEAQAEKFRDDTLIDVHNKVNGFMNQIQSWSPSEQTKAVNDMMSKVGDNADTAFTDQKAAELVHSKVFGENGTISQIKKDPIGYMALNNPVVKRAVQRFTDSPDGANKDQAMKTMLDLMVKYQGPAPKNLAEGEDPKTYLNVPRNQVKIMSTQEAEMAADQINKGSPKDALKTINNVLARYPEAYKPIAFNDMTQLPDGKRIRGEYWAANLNKNASWVDDYLGVIQNAESVRKVSSDKQGDFEKALNANTDWMTFVNPGSADNFQRENIVDDFKNGVLLYAMGLSQRSGISPDKAVKQSVGRVIKEQLGFGTVNGRPIMIPKDQGPNKPMMNDDDVASMARGLNTATLYLDPKWVKTSDENNRNLFPVLNIAGTEDVKLRGLQDAIHEHGVFHTAPDGKSASLYYDDGVNQPFELRDKNNRAFAIKFSELPQFRSIFPPDFIGRKRPYEADAPLYDTTMYSGTNWPVAAPFWMNQRNAADEKFMKR
jgi:hypothetical protein